MGNTNPISEVECDDAREEIADYACGFNGNAHYLWGSCGDAPSKKLIGSPYRPDSTLLASTSTNPGTVSIFAASCDVTGNGAYTCAGSYLNKGGREIKNHKEVQEYLDTLKGKDEAQWGPNEDGLFPRVVLAAGKKKNIVWGEDCRQVRHFDCIGFVNFVYIMKVKDFGPRAPDFDKRLGQYSIAQWALGNPVGGSSGVIAKPPDNSPETAKNWGGIDQSLLKPADVLCQRLIVPAMEIVMVPGKDGKMVPKIDPDTKTVVKVRKTNPNTNQGLWEPYCHHIGIYAGGGWVIQANDTPKGVTQDKYVAKSWHYAVRMPCSMLIIKEGAIF